MLYRLREFPTVVITEMDIGYNNLSILSKLFNFWQRNSDTSFRQVIQIPNPVRIIDISKKLINEEYIKYVEAFYVDETRPDGHPKRVYYKLYGLRPFGFVAGDTLCDVEKLEIDIDRF